MIDLPTINCMFALRLQFRQLVNTLYISGYSISFVALFLSLLIFTCFKWVDGLKNNFPINPAFPWWSNSWYLQSTQVHPHRHPHPALPVVRLQQLHVDYLVLLCGRRYTHRRAERREYIGQRVGDNKVGILGKGAERLWLLQLWETLLIKTYGYLSPSLIVSSVFVFPRLEMTGLKDKCWEESRMRLSTGKI